MPYKQVPPRTLNTNGATILGDYSAAPTLPGGPQAPQSSPSTAVDFQGLTDNNFAFPPDTMGAVGTNHVVTMLNTQERIQSRTGVTVQTMTLANFWREPVQRCAGRLLPFRQHSICQRQLCFPPG